MSSGLPVVATRLSGIPELVIHDETGLLVAPESPGDLAAAIMRIADDPELARRLASAARERVSQQFDLATESGRLAALFGASIAARAARPPEQVSQ
jgi:glycosyltransferase involved in cell wall biosynthesis